MRPLFPVREMDWRGILRSDRKFPEISRLPESVIHLRFEKNLT